MVGWFGKKREEVAEVPKEASSCHGCEICKFSDLVEKKIAERVSNITDEKERKEASSWLHSLFSPFMWTPSHAKKINPVEKFNKAKAYESEGKINLARRSYSDAFKAALVGDFNLVPYSNAYIDFVRKHGVDDRSYHPTEENYSLLLSNPEHMKLLRETYNEFLKGIATPAVTTTPALTETPVSRS